MALLGIVTPLFANLSWISSTISTQFLYLIPPLLIQGPVGASNFFKGMLINKWE